MRFILTIAFSFSFFQSLTAQSIIHHSLSECDSDAFPDFMRSRIISKEVQNDTLLLSLGFPANCCIGIRPKITERNDTLYLIKTWYDTVPEEVIYCACDCCFEMNLTIKGISDTNFVLIVDGREWKTYSDKYPTIKERYTIDQGDTINRIDKYGHRQGLWRIYNLATNTLKTEFFFETDFYDTDNFLWKKSYLPNGRLEEYCLKNPEKHTLKCISGDEYHQSLRKERKKHN